MSALCAFLGSVAIVIVAKTAAWCIQRRTRNAGVVDTIWSYTLGGLAAYYAALGPAPMPVRIALALMGGLWGFRLGSHLHARNRGKPEDRRYRQFRERWGTRADFNMFWLFQFQNVFTLALSASTFLPVAWREGAPAAGWFALAAALWIASISGEALADAQLRRFRDDPANEGQVCRAGLWRWSRHPNYFFECMHWLAYVPLMAGAPHAWVALAAPLVMAFLLLKLSGVPMLEAEMMRRKPAYAEYVRTTSVLVPLPPRR